MLGTANLGAAYGITNQEIYSEELSRSVVKHALSRGISSFDTAPAYGNAEALIGESVKPTDNHEIVTKIPFRDFYTHEFVLGCLQQSLGKLKRTEIYGLMFHDPEIYKKNEVQEISKRLIDSGKVKNIGFSAYSLDALLEAKEHNPSWTIFQLPENILDRRLIRSSELAELAKAKNIFYVRSIFLQGLLITKQRKIPEKFQKYKDIFNGLHLAAERMGGNSLDLCISYALSISWSSGIIIAAASPAQLDEILDFRFLRTDFDDLDALPEHILDPRQWSDLN